MSLINDNKATDDDEQRLTSSKYWFELTDLQKNIAFIYFTQPGISQKDLARLAGATPHTVWRLLGSDVFQRLSLDMHRVSFKTLATKALKAMDESLESPNPAVKLAAAKLVLETEGLIHAAPPQDPDKTMTISWKEKKDESRDTVQPTRTPAKDS